MQLEGTPACTEKGSSNQALKGAASPAPRFRPREEERRRQSAALQGNVAAHGLSNAAKGLDRNTILEQELARDYLGRNQNFCMRLSRKIEKLTTGEAWSSAVDAYYRLSRSLTVPQLLKGLEQSEFQRLRAKYGVAGETKAWQKYVDEKRWLSLAIEQAQELRLDRRKPSRILDLGSGAGYFLYVCKHLGHDGLGLDLDWPALYFETFKLLGLQRIIWHIDPYKPLPDFQERFHLVTAFAICFNAHETDQVWGPSEWRFFLDDLEKNVLEPGGEVFLSLNPESYGHYTSELRDFFLKRGARIDRQKIWLKF